MSGCSAAAKHNDGPHVVNLGGNLGPVSTALNLIATTVGTARQLILG